MQRQNFRPKFTPGVFLTFLPTYSANVYAIVSSFCFNLSEKIPEPHAQQLHAHK